ncbi:MAG: hypothetical protein R2849_13315 [Thermomicrobiales bacterium]
MLRLDRKLTDTYWLNIADPSLPFTVVVEHTNFIDPSEYDGNHYVYVNAYGCRSSLSLDERIRTAGRVSWISPRTQPGIFP